MSGVAVIIGTIEGVLHHGENAQPHSDLLNLVDIICCSFEQNVSESHTSVINVTFKSLAAKHNYR